MYAQKIVVIRRPAAEVRPIDLFITLTTTEPEPENRQAELARELMKLGYRRSFRAWEKEDQMEGDL